MITLVRMAILFLSLSGVASCTKGVDANDKHALWLGFQRDDADLVKRYLASGMDPNEEIKGKSLLWHAIQTERKAVAKALIEAGADCNKQYIDFGSRLLPPLTFDALWRGQAATVNACLGRKADTAWRSPNGMGFLQFAVVGGDVALLEKARGMGFEPTEKIKDGKNGLHILFSYHRTPFRVEKARLLLNWGLNPNDLDESGYRPIDYAARNNIYWNENEEAAIVLLEAGSDPTIKPFMSGGAMVKQSLPELAGHWALPRLGRALLVQATRSNQLTDVCQEIRAHLGDRQDRDSKVLQQMHGVLREQNCG